MVRCFYSNNYSSGFNTYIYLLYDFYITNYILFCAYIIRIIFVLHKSELAFKDKILKSNKTIRKNFQQKQPRLKLLYFIVILVILCSSSGFFILNLAKNPSNGRNKKVDQIKIVDDSLQLVNHRDCSYYDDDNDYCKKFGKLKKGEIYTIIKKYNSEVYEYKNYYIKNKLGIGGWVPSDSQFVQVLKKK